MVKLRSSAKLFAIALVGLSVVGCSNTGPKQGIGTVAGAIAGGVIGNQFGKGSGNVVATAAGAVIGGLIGAEIGRSLDERDQQLAYQAQYSALEQGRSGAPVIWRNPDSGRSGRVVPESAYTVNNRQCRDYTHTVYIDGQPETARGTACREGDGTWRTVS